MNKLLSFLVLILLFSIPIGVNISAQSNNRVLDVYGWAHNDVLGWIAMNSESTSAPKVGFGVKYNSSTGDFSGEAWSDIVGWISFDSGDVANCSRISGVVSNPVCQPRAVASAPRQKETRGFARILSSDTFVSLSSANFESSATYGITLTEGASGNDCTTTEKSLTSCTKLEGWAWAGEYGWIAFGSPVVQDSNGDNVFRNTNLDKVFTSNAATARITVSDKFPNVGGSVVLNWYCEGRTAERLIRSTGSSNILSQSQVGGSEGTNTVIVNSDETFTIHCSDEILGESSANVTVDVTGLVGTFRASPNILRVNPDSDGASTTLSWDFQYNEGAIQLGNCTVTDNFGNSFANSTSPLEVDEIKTDKIFTLTCQYKTCTEATPPDDCFEDSNHYESSTIVKKVRVLTLPGFITE